MGLALGLTLGAIAFVRGAFTPAYLFDIKEMPAVERVQATWQQIALTISLAVMAICLYGTLVGSLLPLVFRKLGFDPAFASSPFVATFVDVTGIVIYFSIAKFWIAGL
jgi:magnesium transporter